MSSREQTLILLWHQTCLFHSKLYMVLKNTHTNYCLCKHISQQFWKPFTYHRNQWKENHFNTTFLHYFTYICTQILCTRTKSANNNWQFKWEEQKKCVWKWSDIQLTSSKLYLPSSFQVKFMTKQHLLPNLVWQYVHAHAFIYDTFFSEREVIL